MLRDLGYVIHKRNIAWARVQADTDFLEILNLNYIYIKHHYAIHIHKVEESTCKYMILIQDLITTFMAYDTEAPE